jgi:hypothetical protein
MRKSSSPGTELAGRVQVSGKKLAKVFQNFCAPAGCPFGLHRNRANALRHNRGALEQRSALRPMRSISALFARINPCLLEIHSPRA